MPQTVELVRVKTTLGDRVYPPDTRVYSNVGGKNLFFREYAGDLKGEEMILWHNESIEKTIEEVEPHLQKSPRYQRAEQTVYATNSHGQKVPQFRIQLIRALAAKGIVTAESQEDLEQKVMQENGKDFTSQQYSTMTNWLYKELQRVAQEDKAPARSEAQIREWLHGKTLGPQNPNLLYSLAIATGSPAFEDWFVKASDTGTTSSGFWGEYKFYTILRQTIMRYLARSKGELKGKVTHDGNGQRHIGDGIDTTPEVQIVLNQFMEEINDEFSLARVVGVERVPVDVKAWRRQKAEPSPHLAKGAYTGNALEDTVTLSLSQIVHEETFLSNLVIYTLKDYLEGCQEGKYSAPNALAEALKTFKVRTPAAENKFLFEKLLALVILQVSGRLGLLPQTDEMQITNYGAVVPLGAGFATAYADARTGENITRQIRNQLGDILYDNVVAGSVDTALGLPHHTVYRCLEHMAKVIISLPAVYGDWVHADDMKANTMLDAKERRSMRHKLEKLDEKLNRKYGWCSRTAKGFLMSALADFKFGEVASSAMKSVPEGMRKDVFDRVLFIMDEYVRQMERPEFARAQKEEMASQFRHDDFYFTRADAVEILEKHGLPELMRFIPEANFVFDPKPDSQPLEAAVAAAAAENATGTEAKIGGA